MNKKITAALMAVLMAACMLMTGCSGNKDAISAAGTGFLDGMQAGDLAAIKEYSTDALASSEDLSSFDIEALVANFYDSMGIPEEDLGEEAQASVRDFCTNVAQNVVKSYEITDVKEEKGVGTVTANIVLGFDPDEFDPSNDPDTSAKLSSMVDDYQNENLDVLLDIYTNEGEDAFYQKLYTDLIPQILAVYNEQLAAAGELNEQIELTVEQQEDKTWKVSAYQEYEVEE